MSRNLDLRGLDNWITRIPELDDQEPLSERDQMLAEAAVACGEIVHTTYWAKPIPTRKFDWIATLDSYDGAPDAGPQYIGEGATEKEAVDDLVQQVLDDRAEPIWPDNSQFGVGA